VQDDGYSCGIITANTIAHALFNRQLWTSAGAVQERLQWFIRIAEFQHKAPMLAPEVALASRNKRVSITNLLNPSPNCPSLKLKDYDSDVSTTSGSSSQSHLPIPNQSPNGHFFESFEDAVSDNISMASIDPPMSLHPSTTAGSSNASIIFDNDTPSFSALKDPRSPAQSVRQGISAIQSESEYDGDWSDSGASAELSWHRPHKYIKAGEGTSKSACHSRKRREKLQNGTFKVNDVRLEKWKRDVLELDEDAEFDPHDIRSIRHSGCSKFIKVKDAYNLTRWTDHVRKCAKKKEDQKKPKEVYTDMKGKGRRGPAKIEKITSLLKMGFVKMQGKRKRSDLATESEQSSSDQPKLTTIPCPGLTVVEDPRIAKYLKRTGAQGGGGRSLSNIAKQMFKRLFSSLSNKKHRQTVIDKQMHEWKWRNDHSNLRVHSTSCLKDVPSRTPNPPKPCSPCLSLLRSKTFQNAIRREPPLDKNYVHVNHRFRNSTLGEIYARTVGVREIIEDEVCIHLILKP